MLLFSKLQLPPNDAMSNLWYTTTENQDRDIPFALTICRALNASIVSHCTIISVDCHECLYMG